MKPDAVVIGGGVAGLSAGVRLADAGLCVLVVDAAPRLGGRASTFIDPSTGERLDNGQHVLFGCYRETFALLRRMDADHLAPLDRALRVDMAGRDGRGAALSCPAWPAPWNLVAGVLKWTALPVGDRLTALRLAPVLRGGGHRGVAGMTVSAWLRAHGQSPELCRWLWNPLAFAALNQSPDEAAAAPFVRVLEGLFGPDPRDSAIALPAAPLDALFAEPAARVVGERGGAIVTGRPARLSRLSNGRFSVRAGEQAFEVRYVVSAVPWHAFADLWSDACPPELTKIRDDAARMTASPIVTVNLWFDRPVLPHRFVGLVDGEVHWAFGAPAVSDRGVRLEADRHAAASHRVSVVAGGAGRLASMESAEVTAVALEDLCAAVPRARAARLIRSLVVRERRATFSLVPDQPPRPSVTTPLPGFFLAGDWTDTGLPATIEGAIVSGRRAAEALVAVR